MLQTTDDVLGNASEILGLLEGTNSQAVGELEVPFCIHEDDISEGIAKLIKPETESFLEATAVDSEVLKIAKCIDLYLEQPTLLDPFLYKWTSDLIYALFFQINSLFLSSPEGLTGLSMIKAICRILYMLCKVRGRKVIMSYFPHSVDQVVPFLRSVTLFNDPSFLESAGLQQGFDLFMMRHIVLLISSVLIMVPFPVERFRRRVKETGCPNLFKDICNVCIYLIESGSLEKEAASCFLSSFLSRNDQLHLVGPALKDLGQKLSSEVIISSTGITLLLVQLCKKVPLEILRDNWPDLEECLRRIESFNLLNQSGLRRCLLKLNLALFLLLDTKEVIQLHLNALSDRESKIRWSAAKGLAKLASKALEQNDFDSLLETLFEKLGSEKSFLFPDPSVFDGIGLALAHLLKSGHQFGQDKIHRIIEWACFMLQFEVPRGRFSTGAAVRDTACFVIWSLARAHACPQSCRIPLAEALVCSSLFDREVNCRRAASAAFQEIVGRWGPHYAPHGVDLLQLLNFFNVSQRAETFGPVAEEIATKYHGYSIFMFDYLLKRSIRHWDVNVRKLAAPLLAKLHKFGTKSGTYYEELLSMAEDSSDISCQHGAIMSLAYLCECESFMSSVDEGRVVSVSLLLMGLNTKVLGWEMLASSVCLLIMKLASRKSLPLNGLILDGWLNSVQAALRSKDEVLHELVSLHLLPIMVSREGVGSSIIAEFFRGVVLPAADKDRSVHAQRGFSLAIGAFPNWLLMERFAPICKLLSRLIQSTSPINHIEKRCNLILACKHLFSRYEAIEMPDSHLGPFKQIFDTLLNSLDDYTIDSRGDIGSKVRAVAIDALKSIVSAGILIKSLLPNEVQSVHDQFTAALLRHVFDKMDRLRLQALDALSSLYNRLNEDTVVQLKDSCYRPKDFFGLAISLFDYYPDHEESLLIGLISSAGSISPLTVIH